MLIENTKAPNFTLNDKDGNPVSLSDFAGKKVVLYFYPRDNTPGCTRQACAFAAAYKDFCDEGIQAYCQSCGATYTFYAQSPSVTEEYLTLDSITLK